MAAVNALVLEGPGRLQARALERPEVGDDDGLLRVEACGLCGTDHEHFSGALPMGAPFVPGHESVGIVEAIGPAAAERWGVTVGDRVAVEVFQSCGECPTCRQCGVCHGEAVGCRFDRGEQRDRISPAGGERGDLLRCATRVARCQDEEKQRAREDRARDRREAQRVPQRVPGSRCHPRGAHLGTAAVRVPRCGSGDRINHAVAIIGEARLVRNPAESAEGRDVSCVSE